MLRIERFVRSNNSITEIRLEESHLKHGSMSSLSSVQKGLVHRQRADIALGIDVHDFHFYDASLKLLK